MEQFRKSLRGNFTFLNPVVTFIVNAAFATIFYVFFLLMPAAGGWFGSVSVAKMFGGTLGMTLGMLLILGLTVYVALAPLFLKKVATTLTWVLLAVTFMLALMFFYWNALTVIWLIIAVAPWATFVWLVDEEQVGFN